MDLHEYLNIIQECVTLLSHFTIHSDDSGVMQLHAFHKYQQQGDTQWVHYLGVVKPNQDLEQQLYQQFNHLFELDYSTLMQKVVQHPSFIAQWYQLSRHDIQMLFQFNPHIYGMGRSFLPITAFYGLLTTDVLMACIEEFPSLSFFIYAQRAGDLFQARKKSIGTPYYDFYDQALRHSSMAWDITNKKEYAAEYLYKHGLAHNFDWRDKWPTEQNHPDAPCTIQKLLEQERQYHKPYNGTSEYPILSSTSIVSIP